MWEILVLPAVDDQAVGGKLEFGHKGLYDFEQLGEKFCVGRVERHQVWDGLPGNQHHMEWVSWPGVVESQQGVRFAQAFGRNEEWHAVKDETCEIREGFTDTVIMHYEELGP